MSQVISEFVYFKVKPSVRPEDPNSEEGAALRQVFNLTKHQSGHSSSVWGRTVEDPATIVWVIGKSFYIVERGYKAKQTRLDRRTRLHNHREFGALLSPKSTTTISALHHTAPSHHCHRYAHKQPSDRANGTAIS